ncbi:MAG: hypothetical protein ABI686_08995 [Acidobacteriota bacterium]
MQEQEKGIFEGYEIQNWNLTPRIYKIIGAAAAFHLLAIAFIAQTNLLTKKGCDSPFVSQICQVLDTVYVSSMLVGTDTDFVSKDYEKTELADADITFIDATGETPPLTYPEGYFALANPDDFAMMQNADFPMNNPISGFPPINPPIQNNTDLMNTPQVVPTPNDNAIKGKIPDSPFSFGGVNPIPYNPSKRIKTPKMPKVKNTSPLKLPDLGGDTIAENVNKNSEKDANKEAVQKIQPPVSSDSVTDFQPNKKPLEDFADEILAKRADTQKKLDLTKSFKVVMSGVLTEDGKLDPKKSRYAKLKDEEQGDQEMVDIAKDAIEAINNSGLFYYLKTLGVDKVDFTLIQDDKQIYAVISSSQKDENKAKTVSSGFNNLLSLAKLTVKEAELKTLLDSAKVEPQGKNFVLNFTIDKPTAQQMIEKKLQEAEAKAKEKQPSGAAQNTNVSLTKGK